MPIPFVSIIIPTYNRATLLPLTLDSFLAQDYPPERYEIIVANNNSTDGTRQVLDSYLARHPRLRMIKEPRQGVHYARNSAAKEAKGEILYFTDDDMLAEPSLLTELVKVFDLDPVIASATGKILGRFEQPPPAWVKRYMINEYLSLTEEGKPEELIVSQDDLVYSCHQAIRRGAFFRCGGFNPENTAGVWVGDGETGLGIKLKQAGYKFAYTSASVIHHMIPPGRTTLAYLAKRLGNQGNSDACTEYRRHRDRDRLRRDFLRRGTVGFLSLMKLTILNILAGRESWHFLPGWIAYAHRRNSFNLRLLRDAELRRMAEVDDWMNDDPTGSGNP